MDRQALLVHDDSLRALARTLVLDGEDAEDAAQDTWVATLVTLAEPIFVPATSSRGTTSSGWPGREAIGPSPSTSTRIVRS